MGVAVCEASMLKYWGGRGLSASYIYMHCTRSWNDTDLVYWYARHLCLIDWVGSICLLYICLVLDLGMTLIWCTSM